jgi:hypothetical protein
MTTAREYSDNDDDGDDDDDDDDYGHGDEDDDDDKGYQVTTKRPTRNLLLKKGCSEETNCCQKNSAKAAANKVSYKNYKILRLLLAISSCVASVGDWEEKILPPPGRRLPKELNQQLATSFCIPP